MIDVKQLREYVVVPTLKRMDMCSESAVNLILGTAAQESRMGEYLHQLGGGPALGIYQIEPATANDIIKRYLVQHKSVIKRFSAGVLTFSERGVKWKTVPNAVIYEKLISDLVFATAVCRIKYFMVPEPLPAADDVDGLARYWKKYYNTEGGSGTELEFRNHYYEFMGE